MPRRSLSYFNMSRRLYADRKAPDGGIASGWRFIKKGGRIKFGGSYFEHPTLIPLVGEYVYVHMGEYWASYVDVYRGAFGATGFFCKAVPKARPLLDQIKEN